MRQNTVQTMHCLYSYFFKLSIFLHHWQGVEIVNGGYGIKNPLLAHDPPYIGKEKGKTLWNTCSHQTYLL